MKIVLLNIDSLKSCNPSIICRRPRFAVQPSTAMFLLFKTAAACTRLQLSTIPHLKFDNVRERSLKWIWENSEAFNLYRGTDWMPDPCKSCDRKEIDWGGCRCQAFALTGNADATDPTCEFSPYRNVLEEPLSKAGFENPDFIYRKYS